MDPNGKAAVVTGGGGGIGLSIAKSLLDSGVSVVLFDVNRGKGDLSKRRLEEQYGPGKADFVCGDVMKPEDLEAAARRAVDKFSSLDIWVNNAGISNYRTWEDIIDTNLKGVVRGSEVALKRMSREHGGRGGVIVNMSSLAGIQPAPLWPEYAASKFGVIGYTVSKGVVLLDLNRDNGEVTKRSLEETHGEGKVHFICCNVTKQEEVEGALKETIHKFSRLDILVNNAGIGGLVPWKDVIDVNLKGVLRMTNEALKYMSKGNGGRGGVVVNIASISAFIDFPHRAAYSASKSAVIGLTTSLGHQHQYKATGVRFFAVCPGFTETNLGQKAKREMMPKVRDYFKKEIIFQKPEFVAASVTELVVNAPNGSIWVVEDGEPAYQISIPDYNLRKVTSE